MRVIYAILIAIFVLFIITFSLENFETVKLKYFDLFNVTLPTYMLIFISFLSGIIFTGFMGIVERFRLTRTITKLNKTIRELRRELRAYEEAEVLPAAEHMPLAPEENEKLKQLI